MHFTTLVTTLAFAAAGLTAPAPPATPQPFSGPYTVIANKPGHPINGKELQAAGLHFFLGGSAPAAYCPTSVGASCPNATDTVFAGGSMYVLVPGGQQTFTQISGALAFTQAHSISQPDYLAPGPGATADGRFRGPSGYTLAACPAKGQPGIWQVFSEVVSFNQTGCTCFQATAKKWSGGYGAWQYT